MSDRVHYRLRTRYTAAPLANGTPADFGKWASESFDDVLDAAKERLRRDHPHRLRVMRDVDGEPEFLTEAESNRIVVHLEARNDARWHRRAQAA